MSMQSMTDRKAEGIPVFDFDGTLCPGDSIVPYLRFCIAQGLAPYSQWLRAGYGYMYQHLRQGTVTIAKEWTLSFLKGKTKEDVERIGSEFLETCIIPRVYQDGIREMEDCRQNGRQVWIVSASPSCYMEMISRYLPVDVVLSTPCEYRNVYTGHILYNLRDEEKVRRIREAQLVRGLDDCPILEAFGDSTHDIPMLRMARYPHWVHPKEKARQELPEADVCLWK